jgi:hypothetical protein
VKEKTGPKGFVANGAKVKVFSAPVFAPKTAAQRPAAAISVSWP